jgi:hypothetical protein
MSEENHEARIAALENTVKNHGMTLAALLMGFGSLADNLSLSDMRMMEKLVAMDEVYEAIFRRLENVIRDDDERKEFDLILNRLLFARDGVRAIIEEVKQRPKPSSALNSLLLGLPQMLPTPPGL